MNIRTHIRRPRASVVIASLALFVALGGSATAATLITGAQIKNGTITGKDLKKSTVTGSKVKNGSLSTSDLSRSSLGALKGAKGDRGPAGPAGAAGAAGTQGPRGIVSPRTQTLGGKTVEDGPGETSVLSNQVPAGRYVVTAKATLESPDNEQMQCSLLNGGDQVDSVLWDVPVQDAGGIHAPVMMTAVVDVTTGPLSIECSTEGTGDAFASQVKLIAVPVG